MTNTVQTVYAFMEMFMYHETSGKSCGYFQGGIYKSSADKSKVTFLEPHVNFENSETKKRLHNMLEVTNLLFTHLYRIPSNTIQPCSLDLIYKFHTREYIEKITNMSSKYGGDAGDSVPFGKGSFDIARYAVGACLACVDEIMNPESSIKNGYALVRPPGHHAESNMGRGYCMLNNIVLTAHHLKERYGLKRIAIFDFDVHHGNGTQEAFYSDPSVLYISIHEEDNFPKRSGHLEDIGEGNGRGYTVNIPLPPGSGIAAYQYAVDKCVVPAIQTFEPEFILVSAGYDAAVLDPLGRMLLVSSAYRYMTERIMQVAKEVCHDRLCYLHEGGYSAVLVPLCGYKAIEALCGISEADSSVADPFDEEEVPRTTQILKQHEKEVVDKAISNVDKYLRVTQNNH